MRRSESSMSITRCRGRPGFRGLCIPTRTAISDAAIRHFNRFSRFDPKTGEMRNGRSAQRTRPDSLAVPAPDGSVWLAEAGSKKPAADPKTDKVTEYQDDWRKHTIKVHPDGSICRPAGSPASIRRRKSSPILPKCRAPTASRSTRRAPSGSPR
jgi:hypothetical protein